MAPRTCWYAVLALTAMTLTAMTGCASGPLPHVVDRSQLKEASQRGQVAIYEAENEVIIALDRLDQANAALEAVDRQLELAEQRIDAAEKRREPLGVQVAEAWQARLEGRREWAEADIEQQRQSVLVARAALELAKADVIQREDLLAGKDFSLKVFREQHEGAQQRGERLKQETEKLHRNARTLEEKWWSLRRRYAARTGDYDNGLWVH